MADTKMDATEFAKKLRARRSILVKRREKAKAEHKVAVDAWRKELIAFVGKVYKERLAKAKPENERYDRGRWSSELLTGAPKPPFLESRDSVISKIDGALRRIAITGCITVNVETWDIDTIFSDNTEDEDA